MMSSILINCPLTTTRTKMGCGSSVSGMIQVSPAPPVNRPEGGDVQDNGQEGQNEVHEVQGGQDDRQDKLGDQHCYSDDEFIDDMPMRRDKDDGGTTVGYNSATGSMRVIAVWELSILLNH